MNKVKVVHVRKRIDQKFKLRRYSQHKESPWRILLLTSIFLLFFLFFIINQKETNGETEETDVMVSVNGKEITHADIALYQNHLPVQMRDISEQTIVEQMINEELLLQEAAKHRISVAPAEVQALIEEAITQRGADWDDVQQLLQERQITREDLEERYRIQLTLTRVIDEIITTEIAEDEAYAFYEQYQDAFSGKPFDFVEKEITLRLQRQKRQTLLPQLLASLRSSSNIKFHDMRFQAE